MNDQSTGPTRPWVRSRGGRKPGGFNNQRSNEHERKNNPEESSSGQVRSPDNQRAGDARSTNFQDQNQAGRTRGGSSQWRGNSRRGNQTVRAFNMHENNDVKTESKPTECWGGSSSSNQIPCQTDAENTKLCEDGIGKLSGKSCITEIEGDLFTVQGGVSLVHCVGADFSMGSGIAVKFRQKFQSIGKLLDQRVEPGGVAFIPHQGKYVFYLVTKQNSTDKPSMDTMRQSLIALREKCTELRVTKLAMPRIGCGQDELSWDKIKPMLEEIFSNDFQIQVYHLDAEFANIPKCKAKPIVKHMPMVLEDIEEGTLLLYIGNEDFSFSKEMESLNKRVPLYKNLKRVPYKPGSAFGTQIPGPDKIYGLICKKTAKSPLNYFNLESALRHLRTLESRSKYGCEYFGLQAFEDENDFYVMQKVETVIKNSLLEGEFWICWPPSLIHKCPINMKQDVSMEVVPNQYPSSNNQQAVASNVSKSVKLTDDRKFNKGSPEVECKWNKHEKKTDNEDKNVKEAGERMNAQTLSDESKTETPTFHPDSSQAANDGPSSSEQSWDQRSDFPDLMNLPDLTPDSQTAGELEQDTEESWQSCVENQRRRSAEKQQAIQEIKEKERQERNRVKPKSCVVECKGDLFDAEDTLSLAHCVGADFRMGSGIAVLFRQKFGSVDELLDQRINQGGVAVIHHEKRFVFYLVTKRESTGKPTYETLEKSLYALHKKCKELKVTEMGMPRIGCGLDRLEWSRVKQMLEKIFDDGFTIKVFNLEKEYKETKKSMPTTTIRYDASYLKDIQPKTGLLYIGCVESFISEEMKSLNEKYPFLQRLSKDKPKLGSVVRTEVSYPREVVYGLICKQSPNDVINFAKLKTALKELRKLNEKKDMYGFYGIQAFKEKNDDNIMGKVETMLRYSYIEVEVWICFPPSLAHLMPRSNSPIRITHSFGNAKSSWCEADIHRMAIMLRDMQRTQESTYRKLLILDTIESEVFGPQGRKTKEDEIRAKLDEFGGEIYRQSTTIENLSKRFDSFLESHKQCEDKSTALEKRVEVLEKLLESSTSQAQRYGQFRSNRLEKPPPLIPDQHLGQQLGYHTPAVYYNGTTSCGQPVGRNIDRYQTYMGMNYNIHPPNTGMYVTQQLPEEFEALYRHARELAQMSGCITVRRENGIIVARRNDNSSPYPIHDYEDLKSLENQIYE